MPDNISIAEAAERAQDPRDAIDYSRFASYDEGNSLVVCDRKNPKAWIKSDAITDLGR